ncbi:unnamed protein product [Rhizoctonia solani]|uniref:Uncharacterized protein n=1 Tax=Rhizoctonia solani TaxID=456999 RepID=A0A8H3CTQ2_9AGAM|nr:unnamed protein product [Rhizoctonia solani]
MRRVFIKREPSPPLRVFSKGDTHNVDNGDVPSRTLYDIAPPEGNQFASPGVGAIDSSLVVGHESALDASPSEMPALKSFYGISQLIGAAEEDESLTEVPVKEEIEQLETVDHNSECDLADSMDDTRNHQRNFASPAINVSKDFRKIQQPHVHMGFRLLVYITQLACIKRIHIRALLSVLGGRRDMIATTCTLSSVLAPSTWPLPLITADLKQYRSLIPTMPPTNPLPQLVL